MSFVLETERLRFRTWKAEDEDLAIQLWGNPEVSQMIVAGGVFSEAQTTARLQHEIALHREHGMQYWPIFLRSTDELVGCCGLRPYRIEEPILEIGAHLRPQYWGQGLAQEALRVVIDLAFNQFGATALFAGHNPDNAASRKLLGRLGFQYTHDELYEPTGRLHPSYLLTRAAWSKSSDNGVARPTAQSSGESRSREAG